MNPRDSLPATSGDTAAAAADWLARRDRGFDATTESAFQQWLAADPRHATAWRELDSTWLAFDLPRRRGIADRLVRELTVRRLRRRRRNLFASAAGVAVAAAVVMLSLAPRAHVPGAGSAPGVLLATAERRELVDRSVVDLNTGAQIEVHFSSTRRDVTLVRGDAHFVVAKDKPRPFVVTTPLGEVRAVGTAFLVELRPHSVAVVVTEGTVAVERPAVAGTSSVPVSAGNEVVVAGETFPDATLRVVPVAPADLERRLAWRAPRLELSGATLAAVIAVLNRENHTQLALADPSLDDLRLSGVFRADQAESFVRILETHYGVRTGRRGAATIVLSRAE